MLWFWNRQSYTNLAIFGDFIAIFLILGKGTSYWSDDEYEDDYDESDNGLIPESFPLDLDGSLGGISGLPSHIEFQVK